MKIIECEDFMINCDHLSGIVWHENDIEFYTSHSDVPFLKTIPVDVKFEDIKSRIMDFLLTDHGVFCIETVIRYWRRKNQP